MSDKKEKPEVGGNNKPDVPPGQSKKLFFEKEKQERNGKQVAVGRWSEGFSNSKGSKGSKGDKNNKPGKTDDVEFEDDTIIMVDQEVEVASITGKVKLYAINGGSLKVNGKKLV